MGVPSLARHPSRGAWLEAIGSETPASAWNLLSPVSFRDDAFGGRLTLKSENAGPATAEAIVTTDLTKWFGEGEAKVTAVNGVALVAHFGEMLFIVGPSGSGKTTTLSMMSGILRPDKGIVLVKGNNIWQK